MSAAPYWTAAALVRSLRHDMVCRPGQPDPAKVDLTDALPLREAMDEAVLADGPAVAPPAGSAATRRGCGPRGWSARSSRPGCPGRTLLGSALHVADHRVRGLSGLLPGPPSR